MAKNESLVVAKKLKNDEFYTRRCDIEAELSCYARHFRDKIVYCNCDNPELSEFWRFFAQVFVDWGLKKLVATYHAVNAPPFSYELMGLRNNTGLCGSNAALIKAPLAGNGDFRSRACMEFLREADIVVTNPPFSLFREYMTMLMQYQKKFLIIGSMNAITYKEFFPLLKDNQVWIGYHHPKQFVQADGSLKAFGNILWYTNLDIQKRHVPLDLHGNYYGNESRYPAYDNYEAIECNRVDAIPSDYSGCIGVPITFLEKYCPEQFEILGVTLGNTVDYPMTRLYENAVQHNRDGSTQGGGKVNTRAAILMQSPPADSVYYTAENVNGYLLSVYPRILIRKK